MKYDKLVRDNIPHIIEHNGGVAVTHIAKPDEYQQKLHDKLLEEVQEFLKDKNSEELADILEVIYALGELLHISPQQLETLRKEKAATRGSFSQRIILDES